MPKKRYADDELKQKALNLRREGYSYREIAEKLGCSVYKVHELISSYENPNSRLKQAVELADKLDELSSKVKSLESIISDLKPLADLSKDIEELKKEVEWLKNKITNIDNELRAFDTGVDLRLKIRDQRLDYLTKNMDLILANAKRRVRDDNNRCKHIDKDGYCTYWYWYNKIDDWNMKPDIVNGKTVYKINVKEHPLICTACPAYEPRSAD
jgi:predicted RNase H-like nuclease (RuvC/YqgF family)